MFTSTYISQIYLPPSVLHFRLTVFQNFQLYCKMAAAFGSACVTSEKVYKIVFVTTVHN